MSAHGAHSDYSRVANLIDIEKMKNKMKWKKAGKEYNECADHADNGSKKVKYANALNT